MTIIPNDIERIISNTNLEFLTGKEVLVTGASGLVGSYFVQTMQTLNRIGKGPSRVYVSSKTGLFQFNLNPTVQVLIGDLTNKVFVEKLPYFDVIIHAACYAQPGKFLNNPIETLSLNTTSTIELIKKVKSVDLINLMQGDKKNANNLLTLILAERIGKCFLSFKAQL